MNKYPPTAVQRECKRVLEQYSSSTREEIFEREPTSPPVLIEEEEPEYEYTEEPQEEYFAESPQEARAGKGQKYVNYLNGTNWYSTSTSDTDITITDEERCLLDMTHGMFCGSYHQKWYYDKKLDACKLFWYGGCDGNENRFNTENECLQTCRSKSVTSNSNPMITNSTEKKMQNEDICRLAPEEGPCQDYSLMWHYDINQNRCLRFWYGGCGGNENRFNTMEECENLCMSSY
ncbi:actinia tenebrosa protease inhibitors-like isoform X1 [Protopterus annectens]|uniref:actinia tenebrosa protease inhibitors-like isoform X1 n=1 Tax=Protopterus annectens TaxID=7888 RepID=UPI001CF9E309|nr:actinia tenebrosa protease inhibitors-like isoform X1 [Protopterus annectens]